jgi:hypothetical protein
MRLIVAGDWHLGTYTPEGEARLAVEFLEWAPSHADLIVLNGDIFEGLFEAPDRAERARPEAAALIARLTAGGVLRRKLGNHDPEGGELSVVIEHPTVGRVLVAHGHAADPMHASHVGHLGDGISRRFGDFGVVRGAAWLAEAAVSTLAAGPVDRLYRKKCLAMVERERCDLGIFGHNHRRHLVPGDRYANAGRLTRSRLEFLVIDHDGAALRDFTGAPRP